MFNNKGDRGTLIRDCNAEPLSKRKAQHRAPDCLCLNLGQETCAILSGKTIVKCSWEFYSGQETCATAVHRSSRIPSIVSRHMRNATREVERTSRSNLLRRRRRSASCCSRRATLWLNALSRLSSNYPEANHISCAGTNIARGSRDRVFGTTSCSIFGLTCSLFQSKRHPTVMNISDNLRHACRYQEARSASYQRLANAKQSQLRHTRAACCTCFAGYFPCFRQLIHVC